MRPDISIGNRIYFSKGVLANKCVQNIIISPVEISVLVLPSENEIMLKPYIVQNEKIFRRTKYILIAFKIIKITNINVHRMHVCEE